MRILKLVIIITVTFVLVVYSYLWFASRKVYSTEFGISFNKQYAEALGLNWQKVYLAMLDELRPKYIRIAATWREIENKDGEFSFADIDWQFTEAQKRDVKIVLVLGQKAPRWPECHVPVWASSLPDGEYRKKLFDYIKLVVEKYKYNSSLEIWQVENEPFINFTFGECKHFLKDLVPEEIEYVKSLDSKHLVIITDSGELSTWKESSRAGDLFGTTIYRIVRTPQGWYWNYDWLPPAFYRFKAELWGRKLNSFFVSELQAEPWFTNGNPNTVSITEQEKSMNIDRLKKHLNYVERIGVPRVYLWGVEWWYWMKEKQQDGRYWEMVKNKLLND